MEKRREELDKYFKLIGLHKEEVSDMTDERVNMFYDLYKIDEINFNFGGSA